MPSASRTIDVPGVGPVLLERSARARYMNITVRRGRVRVAIPLRCPFHRAETLAHERSDWIRAQQRRLREADRRLRTLPHAPEPDDLHAACRSLVERLAELAAAHGFRYNRVFLRNQRTRWGSCSSRNNINLNVKLLRLPDDLRDYVLLHELVHTRTLHHGPDLWGALERCCPNSQQLKRRVRDYAPLLEEP